MLLGCSPSAIADFSKLAPLRSTVNQRNTALVVPPGAGVRVLYCSVSVLEIHCVVRPRDVGMRLPIIAGVALGMVAAVACGGEASTPAPVGGEGLFVGSVSIGPLCPVEPCTDPPYVYTSRALTLSREGDEPIRVPLEPDGSFEAVVPTGSYTVEVTDCDFLGCSFALPLSTETRNGETTSLNVDIDTGIRSSVSGADS